MRITPWALGAAALLVLTGCSGGDETDTAGVETSPSASEEASEVPSDPTDPACLVGDWVLTEAAMQGFYDAIASEVEGITFVATGQAGLSFTPTDYRWTPEFTLNLEVSGVEGQGVTTGTLGGTWTADEGVITTVLGDNSLTTTVTVNGVTQDGSELLGGILASDPINNTPFDCSDPNAPVLQFETSSGRTPVTLTRAG